MAPKHAPEIPMPSHRNRTSPLESARQRTGGSVAEWARICGVSARQYRRYERGETKMPAARRLALYAHAQRHVVQRVPTNTVGRDFVVGDLHGHRAVLDELLTRTRFDPVKDRVFSVGDLVDRGPDSFSTLCLLQEPWFFAVRGNHEDMLLDYTLAGNGYGAPERDHPFWHNGGRWFLELTPDQYRLWEEDLLLRTALLPHILVVGAGPTRFQIVHAELDGVACRLNDTLLDTMSADGSSIDGGSTGESEFIEGFDGFGPRRMRLLWGRGLIYHKEALAPPSGLSPTFCGHTPVKRVATQAGHVFLDTGAAFLGDESAPDAGVTLIEVLTGDAPTSPTSPASPPTNAKTPYRIAADYRGVSRASA